MNKEVISSNQLLFLTFTFVSSTASLFVPGIVTSVSKQDGWLSSLLSGIFGVIVIFIITILAKKYPKLFLIEYSEIILGKWLGRLMNIIIISFLIHSSATIIKEVADTISYSLLSPDSIYIIIFILFIICAYAVKKGIEVIARVNILVIMSVFFGMLISTVLMIKDMNIELLTPMFEKGIMPVINASISVSPWVCEIFLIAFIIPCINKPKEARKASLYALLLVLIVFSLFTSIDIMIFGPELTSVLTFPTFQAIRNINIEQYIERVEVLFIIPWTLANIIKICFYYYVTNLAIAKQFRIENKNVIVLPVGLFIFFLASALYKCTVDIFDWLVKGWVVLGLIVQLFIPSLLLIVSYIRETWEN